MGGSSSRRRRPPRRRFSPRPRPPPASQTRELSFASLTITNGIGYDLLLKSGWQPGSPLGQSPVEHVSPLQASAASSSTSHSTSPLNIVVKRGRAGLGMAGNVIVEDGCQSGDSHGGIGIARSAPEMGRHVTCDGGYDVFDPLRPRCQYDPSHVVSSLKRLRKHEMRCPANPARGGNGGAGRGGGVTVGNLFGGLSLDDSSSDSDSSSRHDVLSVVSDDVSDAATDASSDMESEIASDTGMRDGF